jgi:hypothetical protein
LYHYAMQSVGYISAAAHIREVAALRSRDDLTCAAIAPDI